MNMPIDPTEYNPFADLIGLKFTKIEDGISQCTLEVNEKLLNPNRVLHGGVAYSMADTGMAAALVSTLEEGKTCTTVDLNISYFKAVTSGEIICNTKVVRKGRTLAYIESEIKIGEQLVSKATGTFYIIDIVKK